MSGTSGEFPDARPSRGRPRAERSNEVQQRILDVATELILRQGYSRTTYEQIVGEAHVSKTTLYARFPTKPELFAAVVRGRIGAFRQHIVMTSEDATPLDCLVDVAIQLADATLAGPSIALMRVTASEAQSFPDLAREGFRIAFEESVASVSECLVEAGSFPSVDLARPCAGRFVETALHPLYMQALFGEDPFELRAKARRDVREVAAALFLTLNAPLPHEASGESTGEESLE